MSGVTTKLGGLDCDLVERCVETICASTEFRRSERLKRFLRYVVSEKLAGQDARLKAYSIALAVFDRPSSFDPQIDPVVRIEAGRLRRALERYYHSAGNDDAVLITIPRGGYVPMFELRADACRPGDDEPEQVADANGLESGFSVAGAEECSASVTAIPRADRSARDGSRLRAAATAAFVSALATATLAIWIARGPSIGANDPGGKPLVAVTPFVSTQGDERARRIAQDVSEDLIDRLAKSGELRILGRQAARQVAEGEAGAASSRFRVRYAIEGSVSTSARGGNLTARLVNAPTGEVLWTERYPISEPEMAFELRGDLAAKVAEAIGRPLGAISRADAEPSGAGPKREGRAPPFDREAQASAEGSWRARPDGDSWPSVLGQALRKRL
ncbi:hypothetical protein ABEG18_08030 [Alsobacter sp. KACC 23698]|uniref:TolB amino-terminal domain-containing protein n=1 Tax=Alsobacter sp. KACC 23698 TaxID=3149229 RepID=A0AAU7JKJ2_9HYPH